MQVSFSYDKKKVIQALRYHFISLMEIRVMIILVNVFVIASAILFYMKKIRPEPFFLGSLIWLFMLVAVWYILPNNIYRKANTFRESFTVNFSEADILLTNARGTVRWQWIDFSKFVESPHFFHLYFNPKAFFLIPKEEMTDDMRHEVRGLMNKKIGVS
jgi:YcxB-like protein